MLEIAGLALVVFVAVFLLVPMFRSSRRQAVQRQWLRVRAEVLALGVRIVTAPGWTAPAH